MAEKIGFFKKLGIIFNQTKFEKYVSDFFSGNDVSAYSGKSNAVKFSAVFGCFRVLAETFATVSIAEYKKLENGDREQTDDTGLYPILHDHPNDLMSPYNFQESQMYQLNSGGNTVSIRQKNYLGGLAGLMPMEWTRVEIRPTQDKMSLEYVVDKKDIYSRDQVFHIPGPSMNGMVGMSILEYAANAIELGLSYEKFCNEFYQNGAITSGVFEHPTFLKDESYARLKESLKKEYTGLHNAGTPMLLEDGLKFNQLTMKLVDAEFLSSKKFQIEDICRFCRVPLHLVQSLDHATNNNIEHQSLEFVMYTMLPHFKRFEGCINNQLLTPQMRRNGYYFEYNLSSLIRGDLKSRYEAYGRGRQWGFLSVNDIRRLENMPRIDNGDIYMMPVNMVEAGKYSAQVSDQPVSPDVRNEIERILEGK